MFRFIKWGDRKQKGIYFWQLAKHVKELLVKPIPALKESSCDNFGFWLKRGTLISASAGPHRGL